MQYHALSCAKAGYHVEMVGFGGMCFVNSLVLSDRRDGR